MNSTLEREPAAAGRFYPADPEALREAVDCCFEEARDVAPAERLAAIISPHAGIVYSGVTAAHGFARARNGRVRRAILAGCSHHYRFPGASIVTRGEFRTPLGAFPIDGRFASRLAKALGENHSAEIHIPEHALELQLPFLWISAGQIPIVPILFGSYPDLWHIGVGETIAEMACDSDLFIASTDLSHFLNDEQANKRDRASLTTLLSHDARAVLEAGATGACSMCSLPAVIAAMAYARARQANDWAILDYRTSARVSGDPNRVVGYASVSMERAA